LPDASGSHLATQKAEIRRTKVQSQPRQIIPRDPILKKTFTKKKGRKEGGEEGGRKEKKDWWYIP
jgi:hypothetical protein